jgi:ubiquinone/menaquinone biosynthesis C-methylase UbiE/uncharacterized protein YbaR (Trm112 family)
MERFLFDMLACPECKSDALDFRVTEQQKDEVTSGEIICTVCGRTYTITNGIPLFVTDEIASLLDNMRPDEILHLAKESESAGVKAANILYHNVAAESYERDFSTEGIFEEGTGSQKRFGEILNMLKLKKEFEVFLDVGCGTGNLMRQAINSFPKCIGIDISLGMLSLAYSKGFPVLLGDAEKLPLKPNSVDVISCFSVLHHLFDQTPAFKEFARVLKPGGYLYTDWDPNSLFVGHPDQKGHSFLYSFALDVFRCFRNLSAKLRHKSNLQNNNDLRDVVTLAEYHHHFSSGLDPYALKVELLSNGFTNVKVVFHSNSDSLTLSKRIKQRMQLFAAFISMLDFRFSYPSLDRSGLVFLILAQKSC